MEPKKKLRKYRKKIEPTVQNAAIIGGALLSDSVARTHSGKVQVQGVFTIMWAWGFPCARNWFLTLTVFGLSEGKTSVVVGVRHSNDDSETSLAIIDAEVHEDNASSTLVVQLSHVFERPGRYLIVCSVRDSSSKLSIPIDVREKAWPEYTDDELAFVRENSAIPRNLRANVHCKQCSYAYIFEESIFNEKPKGGVKSFPEDGQFECTDCGHIMNLKDIQGRLRASLKELVNSAMRRDS